jgi:hypothetical protein
MLINADEMLFVYMLNLTNTSKQIATIHPSLSAKRRCITLKSYTNFRLSMQCNIFEEITKPSLNITFQTLGEKLNTDSKEIMK